MATATITDRPIRIGVFTTLAQADKAVSDLLTAGFTSKQISVLCSDEAVKSHFREFQHEQPAGTETPVTAFTGGALGALGGLTTGLLLAGSVALPIFAAGELILAGAGGVIGTLVGAMMSRGFERSLANYYDQAVVNGQILVAVEAHERDPQHSLSYAERIIEGAGAKPMELHED